MSTELFTIQEARDFGKGTLGDEDVWLDADITAKEAEIREWLERACGVNFVSATHTDEYHSGDGTPCLMLDWPLVTAITAASSRASGGTTWTSLTATELGQLQVSDTGLIYWDGSTFTSGVRNYKVTYTAGYSTVPELIKRAALLICTYEMPASNLSPAAESYDADGVSYSFGRGDGFNGQWHKIPEVQKAIRLYDRHLPGIA